MTSEPSLLQMPDVALNEIVKKCDYISIQSLRKVCRDLRNFIEHVKPDYQFTNVSIEPDPFSLELTFNDSNDEEKEITIRYRHDGSHCYVSLVKPSGKNSEHLLNTNYIDFFCRDFAIAMSSQKSIVQQFTLSHLYIKRRAGDQLRKQDLMRNVKSQNSLLKVRTAILYTGEKSMIADFLQLFDPNYLETIKFCGQKNQMTATEMNQIWELEQFKKAKELVFWTFSISCPVEYFSHFEKVTVRYICVTEEMLTSLKQMFITYPNLSSFSILFPSYKCYQSLITSCFGPPDEQQSTEDIIKWGLMIPESEDVIIVEKETDHVKFERKKKN